LDLIRFSRGVAQTRIALDVSEQGERDLGNSPLRPNFVEQTGRGEPCQQDAFKNRLPGKVLQLKNAARMVFNGIEDRLDVQIFLFA